MPEERQAEKYAREKPNAPCRRKTDSAAPSSPEALPSTPVINRHRESFDGNSSEASISTRQEIGSTARSALSNSWNLASAGRRAPGSTPYTRLDYFPKDFLLFIDESHVTVPQVRGMSGGDRMRKQNLVEYGFRLPSAYDNRPLNFEEFERHLNQVIFVSATPAEYEKKRSSRVAEQLIRPTGLLDPAVEIRPIEGQVDDLIGEIKKTVAGGERVLVTTLTKKMAEDLAEYLDQNRVKSKYIHHNVDTLERMEIIRDLRLGVFDVLVGINLLREGLDIPEVALVGILDADKEGLLRSETSLIQTIGRAARNAHGRVILYADVMTRSIAAAVGETNRRRAVQEAYNQAHGIVPQTIKKDVRDVIDTSAERLPGKGEKQKKKLTAAERERTIAELSAEMRRAASRLEFERAAYLRDRIRELRGETGQKEKR